MNIFILQDNIAKPNPEILLISPFKDIWERDTTPKKDIALKEFTYIELTTSPRKSNPFSGYPDSIRPAKVIEAVFKEAYTPDPLVTEAIAQYIIFLENASPSYSLLRSARKSATELEAFLNKVDLGERNKAGMPVYKPKDITAAIDSLVTTFKTLDTLDKMQQQELFDSIKTKSNREINYFEEVR